MSYDEALMALRGLTNYERAPDPAAMRAVRLDRMRELCRRLGDPQRRFRAILVGGTNGKGSICAMLYTMLRESALRVGLYTSPHLEDVRERIRLWAGRRPAAWMHGDDWIGKEEFSALFDLLRPALDATRRAWPQQPPTYFEAVTALAFLAFQRRNVDIAVLEVGLGGRLDATNVVEPAVSVFGPIAVDHAAVLGSDPAAIAREKSGIIKPGAPVIAAPQSEDVLAVLRAACEAAQVPLYTVGTDLTVGIHHHGLDGLHVTLTGLRGIYQSVDLPLLGRHQAANAAAAVAALEALSNTGVPFTLVERGLSRVQWPGRIEVVHDAPLVLLDGAHNPHAARALRETLTELCPGRSVHLIIGMSSDKAVEGVGGMLCPIAVSVTATKSRHPRAMDPLALAGALRRYGADVHAMSDPGDAYTYLLNAVSPEDVIVVTGSLFLVGELRAALRQAHVKPRRSRPLEAVVADEVPPQAVA